MFLVSAGSALMDPELTVKRAASCELSNSMPVVVPDAATDVVRETLSERSASLTVRVPEVERAASVSVSDAESESPVPMETTGASLFPFTVIVTERVLLFIPSLSVAKKVKVTCRSSETERSSKSTPGSNV